MCVVVVVPKGAKVPPLHILHDCWNSNPNGAGFMFPGISIDGKPSLKSVKKIMSFSALKRELQRRRGEFMDDNNIAIVDFAIHFRIASVGGAVPELTHPFQTGPSSALMHNGHISALAYTVEGAKLGAAPPESKSRQQTLGCFREEEASAMEIKEYHIWINAVKNRNNCTWTEARKIVDSCIEVEDNKFKGIKEDTEPVMILPPPLPESDTSRLADILSRLPKGWERNDVCHYLISEAFLGGDRVVIFDHEGLCKIIGEKSGTWEDGSWYSNTYWKNNYIVSGRDLDKTESTSAYSGSRRRRGSAIIKADPPAGAKSLPPGAASEESDEEASDAVIRELNDMPVDPFTDMGGWDY